MWYLMNLSIFLIYSCDCTYTINLLCKQYIHGYKFEWYNHITFTMTKNQLMISVLLYSKYQGGILHVCMMQDGSSLMPTEPEQLIKHVLIAQLCSIALHSST